MAAEYGDGYNARDESSVPSAQIEDAGNLPSVDRLCSRQRRGSFVPGQHRERHVRQVSILNNTSTIAQPIQGRRRTSTSWNTSRWISIRLPLQWVTKVWVCDDEDSANQAPNFSGKRLHPV